MKTYRFYLSVFSGVGLTILWLITLLAIAPKSDVKAGNRYYVKGNGGNDANNGASWAQAFRTVQKALTLANSGDEVWVARGVYYPDNGGPYPLDSRNATFTLEDGVQIFGGFAGTEASLAQRDLNTNTTIFSGDVDNNDTNTDGNFVAENTSDIVGDNAYQVVTSSGNNGTAVLDGFIITAGLANQLPGVQGGGLYIFQSSPTLRNLRLIGNYASTYGGGLFIASSGSPSLEAVEFINNFAVFRGGGMGVQNGSPTLTSATFDGNVSGDSGGGMYNYDNSAPELNHVIFYENQAPEGGGMHNLNSAPDLVDVTFTLNYASTRAGGMFNENSNSSLNNVNFFRNNSTAGGGMFNLDSQPSMLFVDFTENQAQLGAGMSNENSQPDIRYGTYEANIASGVGGGMQNLNGSDASLEFVTFTNNQAGSGGGMYNYLSNPILSDVDFISNLADSSTAGGGGMYNYTSSPILERVNFNNNGATASGGAGGGMYNYNASSPELTEVTFSGNYANNGGGMRNHFNNNQPELTNVTFSANEAQFGGGMSNDNSAPTLHNVTFSGNYANQGGGMHNYQSSPQMWNVTFYGNIAQATDQGGGMYNITSSAPFLRNVILSGSTNGDCVNGAGGTITGFYSLIQDTGAKACGAIQGNLGFIVGQAPKLGPLAPNGGFTLTHSPLPGSPAIDGVTDNFCTTQKDQRGFLRFLDGDNNGSVICDIGAVEFGKQIYLPVLYR
jgi:hypothetical protein